MTVQDESTTKTTHGVILTDAAAAKAKSLLEQEGRETPRQPRRSHCWSRRGATTWRCVSQFSPGDARACVTTCSSTTARSTAT